LVLGQAEAHLHAAGFWGKAAGFSAWYSSWKDLMGRILTLVANSKMSEMILCTLACSTQRNRVDSCTEIPVSVGESSLE